jgi:hypothetical protein
VIDRPKSQVLNELVVWGFYSCSTARIPELDVYSYDTTYTKEDVKKFLHIFSVTGPKVKKFLQATNEQNKGKICPLLLDKIANALRKK